jgi:RimJ/RimL family protein N-acetyltransferase
MTQFTGSLSTERLVLRPFATTDADDLYAYQSREDVVRYLPWPLRDRAESAKHLAERMTRTSLERDGDYLVLAMELPEAGRVIGDLTLFLRSIENAQAEIGWVLHPEFQGAGYAREGAAALIDLAFAVLGSHRVYATLDPRNESSARLCDRLGMRREAHFVQDEFFKGEWADTTVHAILADEWARAKKAPLPR